MGAQLRVYRRRIRSVQSTKKITRAMELIAASRIVKAQQRLQAARPYAEAITSVVSAVTSQGGNVSHPLTVARDRPSRAALIVVTSDRGLAGAYNANVLRTAENLIADELHGRGLQVVPFLIGRKAVAFYRFRNRDVSRQWTGFTEQPTYDDADSIATAVIEQFRAGSDDGGVDEIHLVYTQSASLMTQRPVARVILPMAVEYVDDAPPEGPLPIYEFEPGLEAVLDELLPRYVGSRLYAALLESAASQLASRRRAMKSATDNADDLIKSLTRAANAARQAEITQEIMEIVGGAEALSTSGRE